VAIRVVKETKIHLEALDGTKLVGRLWQGPRRHKRLWVLAPGFAKHGGSPGIRVVMHLLLPYGDVLCMDLRGTGESEGRYGFGAFEHLDLQAAWDWSKAKWKNKRVIGFSMGGYIAIRFAALRPKGLEAVHCVSGPTKLEDVLLTGGPLTQIFQYILSPHNIDKRLRSGVNPLFHWDWPLRRKPNAADLAPQLQVPSHFLVGGFDWLVFPFLTRRIYDAAPGPKSWTRIPWGYHAEYMADFQREKFMAWLKVTMAGKAARKK
jgi:pimeloyl-ACP methyl ester carboxylesterase